MIKTELNMTAIVLQTVDIANIVEKNKRKETI